MLRHQDHQTRHQLVQIFQADWLHWPWGILPIKQLHHGPRVGKKQKQGNSCPSFSNPTSSRRKVMEKNFWTTVQNGKSWSNSSESDVSGPVTTLYMSSGQCLGMESMFKCLTTIELSSEVNCSGLQQRSLWNSNSVSRAILWLKRCSMRGPTLLGYSFCMEVEKS